MNYLLRSAVKQCLPEFDLGQKPWTTIRHTAFRLTLEDDQSLWVPPQIGSFAANGHTSVQQLQDTYLNYILSEQTAETTRENIRSAGWLTNGRVKV